VVWFEESLPAAALARADEASVTCEVFLSIGTATVVQPAAGLPFQALAAGATVVEVNPTSTPLTRAAHHVLAGAAGEVLPELLRLVAAART
jgi:NAD-dependent deacetylase